MLSVTLTCRRPHFEVRASFTFQCGEMLGLFGPSGAGKSTILEVIAGLVVPTSGVITLNGRTLTALGSGRSILLPPWQRHVGLLTQDAVGFPHLDVAANIVYGAPQSSLHHELDQLAARCGIKHLLNQPMTRLSGGERRRVALVQMIAAQPQAFLLDEPYSGLDISLRADLSALIKEFQQEQQLPAIFVSHDFFELQRWCDRIAVLVAGELTGIATPTALIDHPPTPRVAQLLGYTGRLDGRHIAAPGYIALIHPERLLVGSFPERGPVLSVRILHAVPYHASWLLTVAYAHETFAIVLPPGNLPQPQEQITITLLPPPLFPSEQVK